MSTKWFQDIFIAMSQVSYAPGGLASPNDGKWNPAQQTDHQFQSGLESLLTTYTSRLTSREDELFRGTTLATVKITILQIQEQQGKGKKMLGLTRIVTFLEVMEDWEKLVATFADASGLVGFIWGPVEALLQVSISHLGHGWMQSCIRRTGLCQHIFDGKLMKVMVVDGKLGP